MCEHNGEPNNNNGFCHDESDSEPSVMERCTSRVCSENTRSELSCDTE